jgi:hypothetical protein
MRKAISISLIAVAGIFLCLYLSQLTIKTSTETEQEAESEDEQDGIMQALQQDFEMTRDLRLGYVPEYRLVSATSEIIAQRRAQRNQGTYRTNALTWTERGPYQDALGPSNGNTRGATGSVTSGRMRAMHVDLADPTNKTVWVGGVDGGIWKTNDITASPTSWTPINDILGNLAVASIVQDPTDHNIMYYGTGEKTFNSDAVRGGGIWKSTDHGLSWNLLPSTTGFWNVSRMAVDASGNVYVATIGNSAGILRSTNGGASWTSISPSGLSLRITEMKLSSTGRMHIVAGYYNTDMTLAGYRYTDHPATVTPGTWTSAITPFQPAQYNVEIATAGNTVYAAPSNASFETPVIYKSTDGGANWAPTFMNPPGDVSSGQAWYCIALGVDPVNPDNVVVGGLNTYRSTNGGGSWENVGRWVGTNSSYSYIHADQHFVTWNGSQVMIATDGGLFYSSNNGATYTHRNINLRLKQFYACAIHPTSTNYILAGAQDNGVHQLNGPGLSSSVEVTGGDGAFVHIDQDQPQYQFGSYVYNLYRRSTNGGSTWSSIDYSSSLGYFINPTDYDDVNNKLYASGGPGQYLRWENPQSGSTFSVVPVLALDYHSITNVLVSKQTSNRLFMGTSGGTILRVDQADLTPEVTNITGSGMNGSAVSCVASGTDDNNLLATFSNYGAHHIWVTTSGGGPAAWTNITGNLPDIPVRWAMFYPDNNDKAIIATEAGVFETNDINGAATIWHQDPSFPIVRTNMLQYRPRDGTVIAATHGRGIFSAQIPVTSTYVQFQTGAISRSEATTGISGCVGYKDYKVNMIVNRAPVGNATATINVISSLGTKGVDYDITTNGSFATPSNTITFFNGSAAAHAITIRVYDDAAVEEHESFTLDYILSGASDLVEGVSNQTFTFTITDNESIPFPNGPVTATVGNGNYGVGYNQPFRSGFAKSRSQYIYLASELKAAGLGAGDINSLALNVLYKESYQPYSGLTISLKNTALNSFTSASFENGLTPVYSATVSTVTGINNFVFSTPFEWDGTSNLLVQICYDNETASGTNGDWVSSNTTIENQGIWGHGSSGSGCSIAASYAGVGSPLTYVRPDITLWGQNTGNPVETSLNASKTTRLSSNDDVYFYNANGKVIARIQNHSAHDYGCTEVLVDRAGNAASPFWNNSPSTFLTNKTFHVSPAVNTNSGNYTITLYYSEEEKTGWEVATGNNWNNIRMVKVKTRIGNYSPANQQPDGPGAVEFVTPTLGTFGPDYTVTATFNTGFSGFAVGIPGLTPLPMTLLNFKGKLDHENRCVQLDWVTSYEQNSRNFEVEKSTDGASFYRIGVVQALGNSNRNEHYTLKDHKVSATNYYRLRMNDIDGRHKLSQVVVIHQNAAIQELWVMNNPFTDHIDLRLAKKASIVKLQLFSSGGALVMEKTFNQPQESFRWTIADKSLSKGIYFLAAIVDNKTFKHKLVRQ